MTELDFTSVYREVLAKVCVKAFTISCFVSWGGWQLPGCLCRFWLWCKRCPRRRWTTVVLMSPIGLDCYRARCHEVAATKDWFLVHIM